MLNAPKKLDLRNVRELKQGGTALTVQVQKPELEALILEPMEKDAFKRVGDLLLQALKASPLPPRQDCRPQKKLSTPTGADLAAAMQASPFKELCLEPSRDRMPVRDVAQPKPQ